jgi:hypothetical protein
MSEDLENLRVFLEAWGREPLTPEGVSSLAARQGEASDWQLLDPNVVYEDTALPDYAGDAYRGPAGVARAIERWLEGMEWMHVELERIVSVGDRPGLDPSHALAGSLHGHRIRRARRLHLDIPRRTGHHFKSFRDPDEAIAAAGQAE